MEDTAERNNDPRNTKTDVLKRTAEFGVQVESHQTLTIVEESKTMLDSDYMADTERTGSQQKSNWNNTPDLNNDEYIKQKTAAFSLKYPSGTKSEDVLSSPSDSKIYIMTAHDEVHTDKRNEVAHDTPFKSKECISLKSRRIILIGKTGTGKSATGNTILGQKKFETANGFVSCTSNSQKETGIMNGQEIEVIDTPGLYDTSKSEEIVREELATCLELSSPGPHVFLIVLSVGRITEQEIYTLKYMTDLFGGQDFLRHTIIVITRKEELISEYDSDDDEEDWDVSEELSEFVRDSSDLSRMVDQCKGGCVAISNTGEIKGSKRRKEAERLIQSINQLVEENEGLYYRNELFEVLEKQKQKIRTEEERKIQNAIREMKQKEVERKQEIENREQNIEYLQKAITEEEEKSKRETSDKEIYLLELRTKIEELTSENEETSRRAMEDTRRLEIEIQELRRQNDDLHFELSEMKLTLSNLPKYKSTRCAIM